MCCRVERTSFACVAAFCALLPASGGAVAQAAGAAGPPAKTVPCSAADQSAGKCASPPSASEQFPFPGDQPGTAAGADPDDPIAAGASSSTPAKSSAAPGSANAPDAPAASGGKQFPYPGEAADSNGSSSSNASSSSSDPSSSSSHASSSSAGSSSSSSSASSSADPDDPLETPAAAANVAPGRRKLPKVKKLQSDEDREAEDVKVAKFYRDDGNALAAYNRLRDATKLATDDADAWFLLGDVAQKLHKQEEATEAYRKFLALEPNTGRAKTLAREQPELNAKR